MPESGLEQLSLDFKVAEAIALGVRAFGFISGDAALVEKLLAGRNRDELQQLLARPAFLASVLDALIEDETTLTWFAGTVGVPVITAYEARRMLKVAADREDAPA